ncbi:DNA-directed RNA polymerase subunit beta' [Candidatus Daviesbacteria bacterium]|nr:DNA-directed RNA polymerase subunit beta' [Candidatus Daviesbacteria bacterium]
MLNVANDLLDFEAIKVAIASPEQIKAWSFGEVTKPETINYRTFKPEKDGLFSENIFGPTKDYECYCGKYKRIRYRGVICDKCGVEVTQSKVRRERMGHITLASPVAHIWYVKGAPSKLSLVLDMTLKSLESVVYFAAFLVYEVDPQGKAKALDKLEKDLGLKKQEAADNVDKNIKELEAELKKQLAQLKKAHKGNEDQYNLAVEEAQLQTKQKIQGLRSNLVTEQDQLTQIFKAVSDLVKSISLLRVLSEDEFYKLQEYGVADFIKVGMGAEGLLNVLEKINLDELSAKLRDEVRESTGQKHIKATKRLRVIEGMRSASLKPEWMVLRVLPVLPPDLRPMVQLPGGRFATSDLNDLYRRVINRNNRLKRLIDLGAPEIILRNEKRMLQEAVDALIDTNLRTTRRGAGTHILRSLSDMLRGKQGRFRQNLLGKRVDYSGRSVIVVGPKLRLDQVGVPKEMALEMFKPFILREIIIRGLAANVKGAKNVLELRSSEVWDILEEVTAEHPVLINRAPTLHRLGIQAFYPVLIEGHAIQIHPCICTGFNADFDGDQMAVHIPLSKRAIDEAKTLMMAQENILRPASGTPVTLPNREMALGTYFTTSIDETLPSLTETKVFNWDEAVTACQLGELGIRQLIKVRLADGQKLDTTIGRITFNDLLPLDMRFINETVNGARIQTIVMDAFNRYDKTQVAKLIDDIKDFGFKGSTLSGLSLGLFDNVVLPEKDKMIAQGDKEVAEVELNFKKGLITNEEKRVLAQEIWTRIGNEIAQKTIALLTPDNPVNVIMKSGGARATPEQIKQISGMRGFSVDPTGKIVELPTKSNYRQGLSVFEYFTSARGARKGVADKALKTADAGYLTRRLVDVAHDSIIRSEDCGETEGINLILPPVLTAANSRFMGRRLAAKLVSPKTKKNIAVLGEFLDERLIAVAVEAGVEAITVFSPLSCKAKYGLCAKCYGWDMTTRQQVVLGVPVGVVAAQSIGEPGTQLTMRTFHSGGVASSADITQGLPRVEELFEGRTPKSVAPISEIAGKVSVTEADLTATVRVRTTTKPHEEREYQIPASATLLVGDGDLIGAGTQLASGHLDIKEIMRVKGLKEAQRYIVDAVTNVYSSQGVLINEKHFEVIVRKMSDKVRIESQGDTNLLPGEVVEKVKFEEENQRVLAAGGDPATASVVILGITRASLQTESFLSAASFQETTTVLADAAIQGKVDKLLGLKENVIIGRLIPTSPERARME